MDIRKVILVVMTCLRDRDVQDEGGGICVSVSYY